MKNTLRVALLAALVAVPLAAGPASALNLTIQFTGLNLFYDGNNLGTLGNDQLASMTFFDNNGDVAGILTDDIAVEMLIPNLGPIAEGDGTYFSSVGHGLNLFTDPGPSNLHLDWDAPVMVTVDENAQNVSVLGSATTDDLQSQDLPFGFVFEAPVQVTFSTQIINEEFIPNGVGGPGGNDTRIYSRFESFGSGDISAPGAPIPEPATLLTLGLGLLGSGVMARRRRK